MGASKSLDTPFYLGVLEKKLINVGKVKTLAFVFPSRAVRLTVLKVRERTKHEGVEFFTKTMPSLRKSLDKALSGRYKFDSGRFRKVANSELPRFLGELFELVFNKDGWILQNPNVDAVKQLRYVLDVFYKLEIKHHEETDRKVLAAFIATEDELVEPDGPTPHQCGNGSLQKPVAAQSTDWGFGGSWPDRTEECRASYLRGSRTVELRFGTAGTASRGVRPETAGSGLDGRRDKCSPLSSDLDGSVHRGNGDVSRGTNSSRSIGRGSSPGNPECKTQWDSQRAERGHHPGAEPVGECPQIPRSSRMDPQRTAETKGEAADLQPGTKTGGGHRCENTDGGQWRSRERIIRLLSHYPACDGRFGVWLTPDQYVDIALRARVLIHSVLAGFDINDIVPRHGPGSTATGETQWEKWGTMHPRFIPGLADYYPYDQFFYWSPSHLSDELFALMNAPVVKTPFAKILLVPKDSRGQRVISEEMLEVQYIQQGQSRALRRRIESHYLTKGYVNFADQAVNGQAAVKGSLMHNDIDTMDLKDASDRVSLELVRALWPEHIVSALEASRSEYTVLPATAARYGLPEVLRLKKFAPMGSSNCFVVMALTIWALSTSVITQKVDEGPKGRRNLLRTAENIGGSVLVYGDDVITNGRDSAEVMHTLERFGLKLNESKCCLGQLFKESCGKDAFCGVEVQPPRIRVPWSSIGSPKHLEAYCEYANAHYVIGDADTANYIGTELEAVYGVLPRSDDPRLCGYPSLCNGIVTPKMDARIPRKWNPDLQVWMLHVLVRSSKDCIIDEPSWRGLLRWGAETGESPVGLSFRTTLSAGYLFGASGFDADRTYVNEILINEGVRNGQYAYPRDSYLSREWRCG